MMDHIRENVIGSKSFAAVAVNCASKAGEWVKSKSGGYAQLDVKQSKHDLKQKPLPLLLAVLYQSLPHRLKGDGLIVALKEPPSGGPLCMLIWLPAHWDPVRQLRRETKSETSVIRPGL